MTASATSSAAATPTASQVDRESRYSHLLEPIRDLASNWHIDLAGELEEYLLELDNIRITFAESSALTPTASFTQNGSIKPGSFNFAQAALLIQGSACIYSKKVEYLYTLLYQTLDCLIDKKKSTKQQASSITKDGDDLDAVIFRNTLEDGPLLDLDDTMKVGKGIDLVVEDAEGGDGEDATDLIRMNRDQEARSQTLLMRAPLCLLSDTPYGAAGDDGGVSSSLKENAQRSLSSQFKISQCIMHGSNGALLLEEQEVEKMKGDGEKFELIDSTSPQQQSKNNSFLLNSTPSNLNTSLPFGSPRAILLASMQKAKQDAGIVALDFGMEVVKEGAGGMNSDHDTMDMMDGGGGGFDMDDDHENEAYEHKYDNYPSENTINQQQNDLLNDKKKSVRFASDLEQEEEALNTSSTTRRTKAKREEDYWQLLDPNDSSNTVKSHHRPFRLGAEIKKPHIPTEEELRGAQEEMNNTSLQYVLMQSSMINSSNVSSSSSSKQSLLESTLHKNILKQSVLVPYFTEFSSLYLREVEKRKKRGRRAVTSKGNTTEKGVLRNVKHVPMSPSVGILLQDQDDDDYDDQHTGDGGFDSAGAAAGASGEHDIGFHQLGDGMDDISGGGGGGMDDWDAPDPASIPISNIAPATFADSTLDSSLHAATQSYEDLCRAHISAYLKSAEQYVSSSVLTKRVLEWQERLLPLLEEEESHVPYDITAYGSRLLHSMDSATRDQPVDSKRIVDFTQLCTEQHAQRYEVCRMFLATLQLANNGNVEILPASSANNTSSASSPDQLLSMSIQLLSMSTRSLDDGMRGVADGVYETTTAAVSSFASSSSSSAATSQKSKRQTQKKRKQAAITIVDDSSEAPYVVLPTSVSLVKDENTKMDENSMIVAHDSINLASSSSSPFMIQESASNSSSHSFAPVTKSSSIGGVRIASLSERKGPLEALSLSDANRRTRNTRTGNVQAKEYL